MLHFFRPIQDSCSNVRYLFSPNRCQRTQRPPHPCGQKGLLFGQLSSSPGTCDQNSESNCDCQGVPTPLQLTFPLIPPTLSGTASPGYHHHERTPCATDPLYNNACRGHLPYIQRDSSRVRHDPAAKTVTLTTANGLAVRLGYAAGCALDQVTIRGTNVLGAAGRVSTALGMPGTAPGRSRASTSADAPPPTVLCTDSSATIGGINPGIGTGQASTERWTFTVRPTTIVWRIEQSQASPLTAAWNALPSWEFSSSETWKAAFLGTGGVAWFHLLDSANGTLAAHTGRATFWNDETKDRAAHRCPRTERSRTSARASRAYPGGGIRFRIAAANRPLALRRDEGMHRRRYLTSRDDVWQDVPSSPRNSPWR